MGTFFTILHVVAAVFIVGPMAILPHTGLRALREGRGEQVASIARSTFVFTLLSIIVSILGFGIIPFIPAEYGTSITTPWVLISIILWLIALFLNWFAVVNPMRTAAEHLLDESSSDPGKSEYGRIAMAAGVVSLLLIVVVVLMVWKP